MPRPNELQRIGYIPEPAFLLTADDPPTLIPFTGAGYRKVRFALINQDTDPINDDSVYFCTATDTGATAVEARPGDTRPTQTGPLSVEGLPYYLRADNPTDCLVQPFGLPNGEPERFHL